MSLRNSDIYISGCVVIGRNSLLFLLLVTSYFSKQKMSLFVRIGRGFLLNLCPSF